MDWMGENQNVQEQRSKAWYEARRTRVGASEIAIIAGVSPYMTIAELWDQKKSGKITEANYIQQKGIDHEEEFRKEVERVYGYRVMPHVEMNDWAIASLDGINPERTKIFEFKMVGQEYFESIKRNERIRSDHMMQMQFQMMISGIRECFYYIYCEALNSYHHRWVFMQEDHQNHMFELATKFLESLKLEENPFSDPEQQIEDESILASLEELESIDRELKDLEDKKAFIRENLKKIVKSGKAKCGPYQIAWSERKGTVDYAKIPVLKGLDLEPFRKKPTQVMTISRLKSADSV